MRVFCFSHFGLFFLAECLVPLHVLLLPCDIFFISMSALCRDLHWVCTLFQDGRNYTAKPNLSPIFTWELIFPVMHLAFTFLSFSSYKSRGIRKKNGVVLHNMHSCLSEAEVWTVLGCLPRKHLRWYHMISYHEYCWEGKLERDKLPYIHKDPCNCKINWTDMWKRWKLLNKWKPF